MNYRHRANCHPTIIAYLRPVVKGNQAQSNALAPTMGKGPAGRRTSERASSAFSPHKSFRETAKPKEPRLRQAARETSTGEDQASRGSANDPMTR